MTVRQLTLWLFPESDFTAWAKLVGETKLTNYAAYLELLAETEATYGDRGIEVLRVSMTVEQMVDELAARGWQNTPANRAAVVGLTSDKA